MNELDLKEIILQLHERIKILEGVISEYGKSYIDYKLIDRSDKYIEDVLNSIKEGE
jgi:hypothetical protein